MDLLELILSLPPEKVKYALSTLNPLEREVLEILLRRKVALTTQQIVNSLIEELTDEIFKILHELQEKNWVKVMVDGEDSRDPFSWVGRGSLKEFSVERIAPEIDISLFENTYYPGKTYVKLSDFVDALNEYLRGLSNAKTKSEIIEIKKKLVGNFIEIPRFRRIEQSILPNLIASGLVIAREPVGKGRAKRFYSVNPVLLELFEKE